MKATNVFTILELIILVLSFITKAYIPLGIIFFLVSVARLIFKIGNGSFFLEIVYIYTSFVCVLMPFLGFVIFNQSNATALIWKRYMPVDEEMYFSFVLPAVALIGLVFFSFPKKIPDGGAEVNDLIKKIKIDVLKIPISSILTLTFISLIAYSISDFLPGSIKQVNNFLYNSLFASLFYIFFYKKFPNKKYFLIGIILFIILDALRSSMFTIIAYMSGLFLILLLAGRKIRLSTKIVLFVLALFFVSFLQLFKLDLRKSYKTGSDVSVVQLVSGVFSSAHTLDFEATLFPLYYRMNQGFNIGLVMRRIPSQVDYLGGGKLFINFISSFVPRLFWHDKPEAGGVENMKIYAGVVILYFSTNVGPIGEAYGSFGHFGGWLYLIAFAFFIRYAYTKFMILCSNRPIFFLWMPAMFFQTLYVMETDSLQAFNSLIKGAVFLYILYKFLPSLFPASSK